MGVAPAGSGWSRRQMPWRSPRSWNWIPSGPRVFGNRSASWNGARSLPRAAGRFGGLAHEVGTAPGCWGVPSWPPPCPEARRPRMTTRKPLLRLAALAVAICGTAGLEKPAAAQVLTTHRIPAALALEAVSAAVDACAKQGYAETAVLVDADGVRQALLRGDGAGAHSLDSASYKAFTSASFKSDTSALRSKSV